MIGSFRRTLAVSFEVWIKFGQFENMSGHSGSHLVEVRGIQSILHFQTTIITTFELNEIVSSNEKSIKISTQLLNLTINKQIKAIEIPRTK